MIDMRSSGSRTGRTWRLAGFLLVLVAALGARAEPPASKLPGRKPDSREPWGAFLGKAAHYAIGREYQRQYPFNPVFLDTDLSTIVGDGKLGNSKRLSKFVRLLRPDITDTLTLVLFEIKPDDEASRSEGREQAGRYLAALNEVVEPDKKLAGGTGFEGSLFLEFENGGALWRLSWRTPEPGVTLYRWSYRRKKPGASWKERAAQKEEEVPREEVEQRGELAEQAIRGAYEGGERPKGFQGQVYLPADCR
ncbi:hypothetical protein [Archangium violaceum]|uniref:Uncharacterized protein n=1 Tax=Archangium violaceum Cb vi76 TaxID=1406225 RepID=A0A084SPN6_9BACT|nr:hypothetical protein [Archangium violaceum]KFA90421.1 hypothetical protein Q664_28700 [Archangium violaceum Cb vi76]